MQGFGLHDRLFVRTAETRLAHCSELGRHAGSGDVEPFLARPNLSETDNETWPIAGPQNVTLSRRLGLSAPGRYVSIIVARHKILHIVCSMPRE